MKECLPERAKSGITMYRPGSFFFVLNGTAELELNGETFRLQSHEGIEVGPGLPHQMKNTSEADVEFLVISHPQTRGDRISADE